MDRLYLRKSHAEGLRLTGQLQSAYMSAYLAHVQRGQGLLPESAVFVRSNAVADTYEFFFSPQALTLVGGLADSLGATPCDVPVRASPTGHRHDALSLIVGETSAWKLVK